MKQLYCRIEDEFFKAFHEKARSMALSDAALLRIIITDYLKRDKNMVYFTRVQKSIFALVPTIAEAFGLVHRIRPDQTKKLEARLFKVFEDELRKKD